jgi:hypothetical protein
VKRRANASARGVNAEISAQCQQFVVATQDAKDKLSDHNWSKPPPRLRFQFCEFEDAAGEYLGEAVRLCVDRPAVGPARPPSGPLGLALRVGAALVECLRPRGCFI